MLLTPEDFDELYRRYSRDLLAYLTRRTWDPEVAVDLMAETFAAALADARSFRGTSEREVAGWLYGIARHQLSGWFRRGAVERRALRRLSIQRRELTDAECERIVELAGLDAAKQALQRELETFSGEVRSALALRIVEERSYAEVAATLGITEQAARARVSRALRALADRLGDEEVLAHEPV